MPPNIRLNKEGKLHYNQHEKQISLGENQINILQVLRIGANDINVEFDLMSLDLLQYFMKLTQGVILFIFVVLVEGWSFVVLVADLDGHGFVLCEEVFCLALYVG